MLAREFLESYPLYRKFRTRIPDVLNLPQLMRDAAPIETSVEKPPVHMDCPICDSEQTFNSVSLWRDSIPYFTSLMPQSVEESPSVHVARLDYRCASCNKFLRHFLIKIDREKDYVMKVGQEPSWDISLDAALEQALGTRAGYYRNALVCESQSYGIGAFAYYRRIVEEIIDELLDDIPALMAGEERDRYLEALEQAKNTTVTKDKIDLVKDKLPAVLRPGGQKPAF
jgi:hypothetical protein